MAERQPPTGYGSFDPILLIARGNIEISGHGPATAPLFVLEAGRYTLAWHDEPWMGRCGWWVQLSIAGRSVFESCQGGPEGQTMLEVIEQGICTLEVKRAAGAWTIFLAQQP